MSNMTITPATVSGFERAYAPSFTPASDAVIPAAVRRNGTAATAELCGHADAKQGRPPRGVPR